MEFRCQECGAQGHYNKKKRIGSAQCNSAITSNSSMYQVFLKATTEEDLVLRSMQVLGKSTRYQGIINGSRELVLRTPQNLKSIDPYS